MRKFIIRYKRKHMFKFLLLKTKTLLLFDQKIV